MPVACFTTSDIYSRHVGRPKGAGLLSVWHGRLGENPHSLTVSKEFCVCFKLIISFKINQIFFTVPDGKRNGRRCFTHYVGFLSWCLSPSVEVMFGYALTGGKKLKSHIRVAAAFGCPADSRCRHLATQVSHMSSVLPMSHCNNAAGSSSSSRVQAVHVHQRGWPCCKCSLSALRGGKKKKKLRGFYHVFLTRVSLNPKGFETLDCLFREQWGVGCCCDMFMFQ